MMNSTSPPNEKPPGGITWGLGEVARGLTYEPQTIDIK